MQLWQVALVALVLAWMAQAVGTFLQMRHYRDVMHDVATRWSDGYVGAGNAKARLGRGVIILLVVSADGLIRRLAVMEGRSVFAKFKVITAFDGLPLAALRSAPTLASTAGRTLALTRAIEQVDKARSKQTPAAMADAAA